MPSLPASWDQPSWPLVLSHSVVSDASALLEGSAPSPLQKSLCQAPDLNIAHDCECSRSPLRLPSSPSHFRPLSCIPAPCLWSHLPATSSRGPDTGGTHWVNTFEQALSPTASPQPFHLSLAPLHRQPSWAGGTPPLVPHPAGCTLLNMVPPPSTAAPSPLSPALSTGSVCVWSLPGPTTPALTHQGTPHSQASCIADRPSASCHIEAQKCPTLG